MNEWLASTLRLLRSNVEAAPLAPRVRVELERHIPAWWLKAAAASVAVVSILILSPGWFVILLTVGLVGVIMLGRSAAPAALVAALVAFLVLTGEPFSSPVFLLIFGVHLLATLIGVVGELPLNALVEVRVLTERIPRFVVIQAFTQLVAIGAALLDGTEFSVRPLAIGAGVALAGAAWAGFAHLSRATS